MFDPQTGDETRAASQSTFALSPRRWGSPTVAYALVGKRERRLVALRFASWNHIVTWLRAVKALRKANRRQVMSANIDPATENPNYATQAVDSSVRIVDEQRDFRT